MRAVIFEGKEKVSVQTFPDPALSAPDSAIIAVEKSSICGSDLHPYREDAGFVNTGIRPGHEFIGTVLDVGRDVRKVKKGERVIVQPIFGCSQCLDCANGHIVHCKEGWGAYGVIAASPPGGQAEFAEIVHADVTLRPLPSGMSDELAVLMTDMLPTGYNAARKSDIAPGDTVAVIGCGPVGFAAIVSALALGAARVFAVDVDPVRLKRAASSGATPMDVSKTPYMDQIMAATGGRGADRVIEAVGFDKTIVDALMSARVGGNVTIAGVNLSFAMPIPMIAIMGKNLTIRPLTTEIPYVWHELFPLIESGRIRVGEVFSHKFPLTQAAEAYRVFNSRENGCFKVMFDPKH